MNTATEIRSYLHAYADIEEHAHETIIPNDVLVKAADELDHLREVLDDMTRCNKWPSFSWDQVAVRAQRALKGQ